MSKDWNPNYPGDEVVWKSINAVLQDACEEKGTTLDKVYKEISRKEPPGHLRRVIGINLRNAREKVGLTREQVSKRANVPVRRIILIEQGRTDAGFLEWVRIAYALGIKPSKLAEAQEEIEKNFSQGKTGSDQRPVEPSGFPIQQKRRSANSHPATNSRTDRLRLPPCDPLA